MIDTALLTSLNRLRLVLSSHHPRAFNLAFYPAAKKGLLFFGNLCFDGPGNESE